ncbi:MAG: hypothetical protein EAZ53_10055 [Bacteroidetes bacterium]|nr:MAG: hypothetical protein EAZ53_10055 [Bacteroidota bacterium]
MQATVEISLYPLTESYEKVVLDFIKILHTYPKIKVETNRLSTQLFGDYFEIMTMLTSEMLAIFQKEKAVMVLKIAAGELRYKA